MKTIPEITWIYRATAKRVIDGNTIRVEIDLGFNTYRDKLLSLNGIKAPEMWGETRVEGEMAKDFIIQWLVAIPVDEWSLVVETTRLKMLGSYLARVWRADTGECLNDAMIASGHAIAVNV